MTLPCFGKCNILKCIKLLTQGSVKYTAVAMVQKAAVIIDYDSLKQWKDAKQRLTQDVYL